MLGSSPVLTPITIQAGTILRAPSVSGPGTAEPQRSPLAVWTGYGWEPVWTLENTGADWVPVR